MRLVGGRVPERPPGVILRSRIEPDKHHSICSEFTLRVKGSPVNDLAENRATVTLFGRDIGGVNLDVLGGEGLRKSPFGLLVSSSNSSPFHPENEQSQDESPKHNGDNGEHSQDDIVV